MAATYTEVSLEDMDKFLRRAFRTLRPKQGEQYNEYYYDLKLGPYVGVRVWTSVQKHSGQGAGVGSDAIRVQFVSLKDKRPLEKGKAPIVKRTQGWRTSLQDRIEDLIEKYEGNDEWWENWAETRQVQRKAPEPVAEPPRHTPPPTVQVDWSEAEAEDDGEPQQPSRSSRQWEGTFSKLRDGNWGVRVQGNPEPGDTVMVTRKDGRKSVQTVDQVVWKGGGVTLVSIKQDPSRRYAGEEEPPCSTDPWKV